MIYCFNYLINVRFIKHNEAFLKNLKIFKYVSKYAKNSFRLLKTLIFAIKNVINFNTYLNLDNFWKH